MDKIRANIEYTSKNWTSHMRRLANFLYTERIHYHPLYQYLSKIKNKNESLTLLDIGFGSGYNILNLQKKFGFNVIGTDIVQETVDFFNKKKIPDASCIKIDPYDTLIPLDNESIDIVVCSHVLEHVPNDNTMLKEVYRILKKAGFAYFNVPINEEDIDVPNHLRKYNKETFSELLEKHCFEIEVANENDPFSRYISWLGTHKNSINNFAKKILIFLLSLLPLGLFEQIGTRKSQFVCIARKAHTKRNTD